MNRRAPLYGSICATLAAPHFAEAQQADKVYRVGLLGSAAASTSPHLLQAFRQELRDLGWVEGRDIVIADRWAEGRLDRLTDLAADLVRLGVDVIVSEGTPGPHAAKHVTRTTPIVMVAAGDPVASGLVPSLTRLGGNVTGLRTMAPELGPKRVQLLKETVPGLARVGVLWNSYSGDPQTGWRAHDRGGFSDRDSPRADRGLRRAEPAPGRLWVEGVRGWRRPHDVRGRPDGVVPARCQSPPTSRSSGPRSSS